MPNNQNSLANQDPNNVQRRKLNIEEEEQKVFNSDEEEEKIMNQDDNAKLFHQPPGFASRSFEISAEELKNSEYVVDHEKMKEQVKFTPREVPAKYTFLDNAGKPQRNVPIYELDELWEIPTEFDEPGHNIKENPTKRKWALINNKLLSVDTIMEKYSVYATNK